MAHNYASPWVEIATPVVFPPAGMQLVYPKPDGLWYTMDDAGVETPLSSPSGGPAPAAATFITQTPNSGLSAEQALSALATGLVFVTTATGVLTSVAAPAGAVVGTTDTQTLTNKSIVATQLTGDVAVARIATALTTPGAIGGATPAAGTFTALISTTLVVASDTDASTILGRTRLDSRTTDEATFSHFDQTGAVSYGLRQTAAGATALNAATGQSASIRVNNAVIASISASLFAINVQQNLTVTDALTVSIASLTALDHESSGTPGAGFGGDIPLRLESSTTASQSAALIEWLWVTATHASRAADLVLSAYNVANKREGLRIRGGAAGPEIGLFGVTPVVRQTMGAATAGAAYTATEQAMIQAVYDAVRNIGIGT